MARYISTWSCSRSISCSVPKPFLSLTVEPQTQSTGCEQRRASMTPLTMLRTPGPDVAASRHGRRRAIA
eukprot:m51a1_g12623 hypothetical protein (69) ;mRNA; f:112-318